MNRLDLLASQEEFFADHHGVPRDERGRPLLVPPGMPNTVRVPYTRASTHSSFLEDHSALARWRTRLAVKGVGEREDLAALAAALPPLGTDPETDRETKTALDDIIERALDHAGAHRAADYGTAIHGFTAGNAGPAPSRMRSDISSYKEALDAYGIKTLGTEVFTVNDELGTAGTFDHLYEFPGYGVIVGDKKTGAFHPLAWAVQIATYSHGQIYHPKTDQRSDIHPDLNRDVGLVVLIPRKSGMTKFWLVDLKLGYELAKIASKVRDLGKGDELVWMPEPLEIE